MAFISNTERNKLISKTQKTYWWRKFIITFTLILTIAYAALATISALAHPIWADWLKDKDGKTVLTDFGLGMVIVGFFIVFWSIFSFIALWTMRSPAKVIQYVDKLQSSALQGVKIDKEKTTTSSVSRERIKKKK